MGAQLRASFKPLNTIEYYDVRERVGGHQLGTHDAERDARSLGKLHEFECFCRPAAQRNGLTSHFGRPRIACNNRIDKVNHFQGKTSGILLSYLIH